MGYALINKLRDENILDDQNQWHIKDEFTYISMTKESEKPIRDEVKALWT